MFFWFVVDAELTVTLSDFFKSYFLKSNCFQYFLKKHAFLINNFTMTSSHEMNPEKSLCYEVLAINGNIIVKSKRYMIYGIIYIKYNSMWVLFRVRTYLNNILNIILKQPSKFCFQENYFHPRLKFDFHALFISKSDKQHQSQ